MSSLALLEVQHALYAKLSNDTILMGLLNGIYDVVPQTTPVPYIVLGNGRQNSDLYEGLTVAICNLELTVWTEATGRKQALVILNRLHALLHLGTLTVSGFSVVQLQVVSAATELEAQGSYISGSLEVRIVVTEA